MGHKFDNKELLYLEYVTNRLDAEVIAKKYDVGLNTVRRALYRHGINKMMRFHNTFTEEQKSVLYDKKRSKKDGWSKSHFDPSSIKHVINPMYRVLCI